MKYLLTTIRLTPSGSGTVHIYTNQYTEQHNETEYPERNIHNNKNTEQWEHTMYKIKLKLTKHYIKYMVCSCGMLTCIVSLCACRCIHCSVLYFQDVTAHYSDMIRACNAFLIIISVNHFMSNFIDKTQNNNR
jgi:hypothetical protein